MRSGPTRCHAHAEEHLTTIASQVLRLTPTTVAAVLLLVAEANELCVYFVTRDEQQLLYEVIIEYNHHYIINKKSCRNSKYKSRTYCTFLFHPKHWLQFHKGNSKKRILQVIKLNNKAYTLNYFKAEPSSFFTSSALDFEGVIGDGEPSTPISDFRSLMLCSNSFMRLPISSSILKLRKAYLL